MGALASCAARRLALRPDVGLVMAGEADATLLGDAMAFYVPRSQDTFDGAGFLAALKSQGAAADPCGGLVMAGETADGRITH